MSKTVTCDIKRFAGTVTFADPLTYPQYITWKDAIEKARQNGNVDLTVPETALLILPGVLACVESFDVDGIHGMIAADQFPATPRLASARFVVWLINQVGEIVMGVDTDLKEPEPPSTSG